MKSLFICFLVSIMCTVTTSQAQSAENLFHQGMMLEEGEGNLNAALKIYYKLTTDVSASRNIRANALLHVGICYEKMGNPDSRKTYQKLISEYADQEVVIALGKSRLKELKIADPISKSKGIVATQVWSPAKDTYGVSPNGRYLNYIDWHNISLNIRDLKKESTRVLSKTGTWKRPMQFPDNSIWSPDSKKLAYTWFVGKDTELHIVNLDGSSDKIIAKRKNGTTPWPIDWTPDGKYILASVTDEIKGNKFHEIVLFSVNDGSEKKLKTLSDCGCYMDISPDNKYIIYAQPQKENSKNNDIYILSLDGKIDKKIVSNSANDANPVWARDGNEILFVSNRYGTNDLWKLKVENGNPIEPAEIVKVDLGSRYRLFHVTKDESVFYGTSNTRNDIFTIDLDDNLGADSKQPIKISKLEEKMNITPIWSPDGRYVAYFRAESYRNNVLGRQHLLTIFDTKTGDVKNIDTEIYGAKFTKPTWSPDGKQMLFFGIIEKELQAGIFSFDLLSKKITPIKVKKNMPRQKAVLYDNYVTYSNDGKNIYYLTEDFKRILKFNLKSKQESTIISGENVILYFKLSNDNSKIAFGYWDENIKDIYVVPVIGGEKKKILETDCDCSPNVLSWSKDDKYLYYKQGKWRNLKKIMRVSVNGGDSEIVYEFKKDFDHETVINANMSPDGDKLLVELMVGKGNEVWKIDGVFSK